MIPLSVVGVSCFQNDRRNKIGKNKQKLLYSLQGDTVPVYETDDEGNLKPVHSFMNAVADRSIVFFA